MKYMFFEGKSHISQYSFSYYFYISYPYLLSFNPMNRLENCKIKELKIDNIKAIY